MLFATSTTPCQTGHSCSWKGCLHNAPYSTNRIPGSHSWGATVQRGVLPLTLLVFWKTWKIWPNTKNFIIYIIFMIHIYIYNTLINVCIMWLFAVGSPRNNRWVGSNHIKSLPKKWTYPRFQDQVQPPGCFGIRPLSTNPWGKLSWGSTVGHTFEIRRRNHFAVSGYTEWMYRSCKISCHNLKPKNYPQSTVFTLRHII